MGTLHELKRACSIISRSGFLGMRNVSDKSCREYQNTHFLFRNFFFSENRVVCEIVRKNFVEPDRPSMTVWRIACWIPKDTKTHSEYVILIALPLQQ
jgi:hypothetical protein